MNRRELLATSLVGGMGLLPHSATPAAGPAVRLDGEYVKFRFDKPSKSLVKAIYDDYWSTKDGWVLCWVAASSTREGWQRIEAGVCRIEDAKAREEKIFGWDHIAKKLRPSDWSWAR